MQCGRGRARFPFLPHRLRLGQQGQGLAEFGLALPILLIVIFGIMEFGLIFMDQIKLNNIAREGARAGAIPPNIADATRTSQATAKVTATAGGLTSCTLQPTNVTLYQDTSATIRPGELEPTIQIQVDVSCPYQPVTPIGPLVALLGRVLNLSVTLRASAYQYIY